MQFSNAKTPHFSSGKRTVVMVERVNPQYAECKWHLVTRGTGVFIRVTVPPTKTGARATVNLFGGIPEGGVKYRCGFSFDAGKDHAIVVGSATGDSCVFKLANMVPKDVEENSKAVAVVLADNQPTGDPQHDAKCYKLIASELLCVVVGYSGFAFSRCDQEGGCQLVQRAPC